MGYVLDIFVKGLPRLQVAGSGGGHWRSRYAEAKRWKAAVAQAVLENHYLPDEPLSRARVTFERYSSKEPDVTNLCASFKSVEDGLVEVGVIEDDKPSVIGSPTYNWVKVSPKDGRIRIRVEEV